jgi:hypothetical protein
MRLIKPFDSSGLKPGGCPGWTLSGAFDRSPKAGVGAVEALIRNQAVLDDLS